MAEGQKYKWQCTAPSTSQFEVSILVFLCLGHEYPYSIKMNHIRDSIMTQGLKGTPINSLQEFLHMEPVPQEMRCQFTIKPSRLDALMPVTGESLLLHSRVYGVFYFQVKGFVSRNGTKAKSQTCSQMR